LPPLSEEERRVYDAIDATETSIDDITAKSELPSAAVSSTLLQLELKRLVKQLPGKYFVKLG
jgi:DNA processing protein